MATFLSSQYQRRPFYKSWLFVLILLVNAQRVLGQNNPPAWEWVNAIGGGVGNPTTCFGVAADTNGNSYVTGGFTGTAHFGAFALTSPAQTKQLYVAKVGPAGAYQWVTSVTGYGRGEGQAVAVDATGNIYVTGNFDGQLTFGATTLTSNGDNDVFVAKLSSTGAWLWAASGGGYSLDVGRSIKVSPTGTVFVSGQIRIQAAFGNTPPLQATSGFADIFVAALDAATGTWQWSRCAVGNPATTAANNYGWSLGLNAAGEVYLAGTFSGQATFGATTLTSPGSGNDIYVAKMTAAGTWLWARQAGGTSSDECRAVAVDGPGNVYLTGWYSLQATFGSTVLTGSGRTYVAKLDTNGAWQWAIQSAGSGFTTGRGISLDTSGQNLYIGGNYSGTITLGPYSLVASGSFDQYVASLNAAGTWLWAQQASGTDRIVTNSMTSDANGTIYTCGYATSTSNFGRNTLAHPNPPAEQPFVARLAQSVVTATLPSAGVNGTAWPSPAAPKQVVHMQWATGKIPVALIIRDALGRVVYQDNILNSPVNEAAFLAPSLAGWYQCQLLFLGSSAVTSHLVVQP